MKMTKNLTHIASSVEFEPAMTEEQLEAVFAQNGVTGFPAELDIAERTEEHVQMVSLEKFIAFAKASGLSAVTYDVTYFPHADDAEVEYQLKQLARDLEISVEVIRDVCADEIAEYIKLDAERDALASRAQHRGVLHRRHCVRLVRHESVSASEARGARQAGCRRQEGREGVRAACQQGPS